MLDLSPFVAAGVLSIEAQSWRYQGVKERAVREALGIGMTRYYQLLNRLVDGDLALQLDPVTTRRLQRVRAARQRSRSLWSA